MKVCDVSPSNHMCRTCLDAQMEYGGFEDCHKCDAKALGCELINVVKTGGIFGSTKAIIVVDGKLVEVPIGRVHNVREVT